MLDRFEPRPETPRFDLVQGSHVIVPESVTRGVYYVESIDDRRPLFVMPWYENTLIGTTETLFEGDPSDVRPLDSEIDYLLRTYRHYFPGRPDDAISQFAGLRVLPRRGSGLNTRPRETALLTDQRSKPRLVSIAGGKLTAYRATAEEVLDRLKPSLPEATPIAQTDTLTL
ncbi:MAG: FAD-dependent oxidoreductase [Planctomycetota bacterium]